MTLLILRTECIFNLYAETVDYGPADSSHRVFGFVSMRHV